MLAPIVGVRIMQAMIFLGDAHSDFIHSGSKQDYLNAGTGHDHL
jgi:hypothetical protein